MEQRTDSRSAARGLTVKQLTFIFIAGVGVCAIFFTLGFLVGSNERNVTANNLTEERVSPPGDIPPPVNPPPDTTQSPGANSATPNTADSSGQVQEQTIPATASPDARPPQASTPSARTTKAPLKKPPAAKSSTLPTPSKLGSGVIVQIAALHSVKDAESMVATLRSQGYPAFMVTPGQARTYDGVYRVQVGPYSARPAAEKVKEKLLREGFNPFIK